jgi:hypothetical protein
MKEHIYTEPLPPLKFDKNRFRVKHCPCGKSNKDGKFSPYIGHEAKGFCHSCGETFLPELTKVEQWNSTERKIDKPQLAKPQPNAASFISYETFKASLKAYEANCFVKYLNELFGVEVTSELVKKYFIGSSKHWQGATVFWQIDKNGKIRAGKIMLYSPTTGKRVKEPFNHFNWVHSLLKTPEFELRQCFFGEHLLIDKTKPVAIVESEKTAVIASAYKPEFIWLATGGKEGLKAEKCSVLAGRTVKLFPDLNCFDKWSAIAKKIFNPSLVEVDDLLERKATEAEKKQQFDIADYLVKFDLEAFTKPKAEQLTPPPPVQEVPIMPTKEDLQYSKMANRNPYVEMLVSKLGLVSATTGKPLIKVPTTESEKFEEPEFVEYFSEPEQPKPECWEQEISELEYYFKSIELPTQPIMLNGQNKISNCSLFIERHLETAKANNGKRTFLPYLNRLQELKQILTINLKQHESE